MENHDSIGCITPPYVATKGTIKIRKSTKTENQAEAIRFAKNFYEDLIVKKKMGGLSDRLYLCKVCQ